MDLFVKDGNQIYKVNYICMCNECRKRGMPELELVDQEGNYVDYIKMSDLFNGKYELFQKTNKRSEKICQKIEMGIWKHLKMSTYV